MDTNAITLNNQGAQHSTLMLLRKPVRMIDRYGDTWLVVSDLYAAIGVTAKFEQHWKEVPEMERDVYFFKVNTGKAITEKIISVEGLQVLLKNVPIPVASKVLQWAQMSLTAEAA
ncbi:hypothetical protein [Comamonas testosteroni]|uniref:hypothetical protein n=1 Tax=Comamonas testosteroni TaxID=285 RepID=UPI0005B5344E|nr:hypothetical protein [Comamonas testosteroni]